MALQVAARSSGDTHRSPRRALRDSWPVGVLLALPFLIGIAALRGLTVALPIFHGSDELAYHYPTILRFSRELPFPDLHSYPAAQTPLFHLLMAYVGKVIGYELWRLRLVEALISYCLALATYALLHRRLHMRGRTAVLLTLLFTLSPYVLGASFRLGTDNLALLFSVLALERLERFREVDRMAPFLVACACIGASILTRQSTAFLPAIAAVYLLRPGARLSIRARGLGVLSVAISVIPAGLLFLNWHGLVPVGGDPSSCGLCPAGAAHAGAGATGLEVPTLELALATIAVYGAVLFGPLLLVRGWARRERGPAVAGPLAAACAGLLLLLIFPATPGAHAAGDVWKVAGDLPKLDGSSLLFWLLVPLAGALLWVRLRAAPSKWLPAVLAAAFVVSAVAIRYPWQKYVDPFALLILLTTVRPSELDSPAALTGVAVLAIAFLVYVLDTGLHHSATRATGAPRPRLALATPASSHPATIQRVSYPLET